MARRSDNTKEELREMAVSAGLTLLDNGGASAMSARKITREMGYTIGTLYQLFDNYDALILHIRGVVLDELHELLSASVKASRSVYTNTRSLAQTYLTFARTSYPRWHILFSQPDLPEATLPQWYKEKLKALFEVIEGALRPAFGKKKKCIQDEAKILWAGVHGICVLSITQKLTRVDSKPAELLMDRFLKNYMRALDIKP